MTQTQMAMIMKRLKAAEPTIVLGPRSPASKFLPTTSMTDNMISGADEPSAMSVRLDTVSFHICTVKVTFSPSGFVTVTSRSLDVITYNASIAQSVRRRRTSMEAMKRSDTIEIPRNM